MSPLENIWIYAAVHVRVTVQCGNKISQISQRDMSTLQRTLPIGEEDTQYWPLSVRQCVLYYKLQSERQRENKPNTAERERNYTLNGIVYRNRKNVYGQFQVFKRTFNTNKSSDSHTYELARNIRDEYIHIHNICKNSGTVWTTRRARERSWLLWGASESGIVWKSNR